MCFSDMWSLLFLNEMSLFEMVRNMKTNCNINNKS